jgi:hypothetical protein
MAIARVIRIDAMNSLHQQSRTRAGIFNRNGQSRPPPPSGGDATVQVPQVVFGKSRNVDAQLPLDFLSDIEKRNGSFAMPSVGTINDGDEIVWVVLRCRRRSSGGGVGLAGVLGLEVGNRAGCALSQQDRGNRSKHDGEK